MMTYVMGIDSSTTSVKALIVDREGQVISSHSTSLPISRPKPLWSEQNPEDWWNAAIESIRGAIHDADISPTEIEGIGLTGQMHGLVMLDAGGNVLRPSILWNDQRTQKQCDDMTQKIGFKRLIELTGNRALTGFTAPKILWVRDNEPDVYARCAKVLLPKDYIRYKLTGDYAIDVSDASGMSLVNVAERKWSTEVLSALDIPADWLPALYEGTAQTGVISAQAAELTGLAAGTPVFAGGGDQAAGAVGVGAVESHIVSLVVGTSGVVFTPLSQYAYEPEGRLHAFCHAVPGLWHFMGVMLSAAGSLQWYKDTLADNDSFDDLLSEAADIPPGSEGLYFLPYLAGERTPHPDPFARGAFIGLTSRHGRGHMTRAVLEGIAFGLKDSFTLIEQNSSVPNLEVRISGGGAKSPIWQQIITDVIGVPIVNVQTTEGAAYGAALLATVGSGWFSTVPEACAQMIHLGAVVEPGANKAAYPAVYERYRQLYPLLRDFFASEPE
jgi:xylulokinase